MNTMIQTLESQIEAISARIDGLTGEASRMTVNTVGKADRYALADSMIAQRSKMRIRLACLIASSALEIVELPKPPKGWDSVEPMDSAETTQIAYASIVGMPACIFNRIALSALLACESSLLSLIGRSYDSVGDIALTRVSTRIAQLTIRSHCLQTAQLAYVA